MAVVVEMPMAMALSLIQVAAGPWSLLVTTMTKVIMMPPLQSHLLTPTAGNVATTVVTVLS